MAIIQNIDLNLIPDSEAVVVKVNQYDDGTGRIQAHLYLNDTAYTPASGATVRIEGTKPDKHGFSYTASISGNTVTANLTTQMTAVAGRTRAQIIVEEPSGKTGTFAFWLDVQAAALADDTDISDTELPAIMDLARQNAAIASAAAESAAASAATAQTAVQGVEEEIAPVEETTTASQAYAVNDFLIYNGKLYQVTSPIAIGGTITPGTNCTETSVSEAFVRKTGDTVTGNLTATGEITDGQGNVLSKVDNRVETMPTASASNAGDIVQYVGTTTTRYTTGYFYQCQESSGSYSWVQVEVQPSGGDPQDIFIAEYDVTTYADINAAYTAGKFILVSRSLNGTTMYALSDKTADGTYYFRSFSNSNNTNYGCYITSSGTWAVNSYSYATLSSPAFTGTPTAPTAAAGTDTTQIATTAFVNTAIGSAPKMPDYTATLVSGTVNDDTLAFTDNAITATCIIDGPYIEDVLIGIDSVAQSGTTVTYTLEDDSADGASAYIWVRTLSA